MIKRVIATDKALALIAQLQARHGTIFFYQSGGCCEGSVPMCYAHGDMTFNSDDVQIGEIGGVPFHVSQSQCDYLMGSQLTIDVGTGSLGTFSLEDADGLHFLTQTRIWTDDEWHALEAQEAAGKMADTLKV